MDHTPDQILASLACRFIDMSGDLSLTGTDDGLDIGCLVTVRQVLDLQLVGRRNRHGTDFVQGQDGEPEFIMAFQDQHDGVALFQA